MNSPKILVASPVHQGTEYCIDKFLEAVKNLNQPNYDILLVDNSKTNEFFNKLKTKNIPILKDHLSKPEDPPMKKVANSRNIIIQEFLKNNYTHLLCLDSDVIPAQNIIELLLAPKKSIMSGTYYSFQDIGGIRQYYPLLMTACDEDGNIIKTDKPDCLVRYFYTHEIENKKLIQIEAMGLGCVLVERKVLENFKFKYQKSGDPTDDMDFCIEAKRKGYKLWANPQIKCPHLTEKKTPIKWQ